MKESKRESTEETGQGGADRDKETEKVGVGVCGCRWEWERGMEGVNTVQREEESEEESHWREGEHDSAMDSTSDSAVSSNMFMLCCYKGILITGSKI